MFNSLFSICIHIHTYSHDLNMKQKIQFFTYIHYVLVYSFCTVFFSSYSLSPIQDQNISNLKWTNNCSWKHLDESKFGCIFLFLLQSFVSTRAIWLLVSTRFKRIFAVAMPIKLMSWASKATQLHVLLSFIFFFFWSCQCKHIVRDLILSQNYWFCWYARNCKWENANQHQTIISW